MKSFITKFLFFVLLYVSTSVVISYFTPYHWGNPWFSTKIKYIEDNKQQDYNAFFFGSSRVYRQIDTKLFDSTFNSFSKEKINSFNLGAPATFNPQSYYLLEEFLDSPLSKNTRYCFMELMEVDLLNDFFMHEERTSYWQNFSDLVFVGKSNYNNTKLNQKQKTESAINYSISYLENILHLGHFGEQMINSDYYDKKYVGSNNDGYFSLDYDYKTTKDETVKNHLKERKKIIIDNPELIDTLKLKIIKAYQNTSDDYDHINLSRILELIKKSKQKDIDLIFILSPRNGNQQLINLSQQIPKTNIIDLCNPENNNFLYLYKNSFDLGHLNTKGTELYSKKLATQFGKILKNTD